MVAVTTFFKRVSLRPPAAALRLIHMPPVRADAVCVSAARSPLLFRDGHSSVVSELHKQLNGVRPDILVVSVGGGLLCGIVQGLHRVGWRGVPVVAMETKGADSLAECARSASWAKLNSITRFLLP